MTEHTPGPWRVETTKHVHKRASDVADIKWRIVGANGQRVIDCSYVAYEGGGAAPENPADESLILAAPSLLAACKAAMEVIMSAQATIYGEWGCPLPEYDFVTEQLRDAIAKAEGREP